MIHYLHAVQAAIDDAGLLAAPAPTGGTTINTESILAFFASKILPILIAALAAWVVARSSRGETSKVITAVGTVIVGLVLFAGAGLLLGFGDSIVHTIFG